MKIRVELDNDPVLIDAVGAEAKKHLGEIKDLSATGNGGMELIYDFKTPEMALAFKQTVIPLPGVSSADGQEEDQLQPQRQWVLPTTERKIAPDHKKKDLWRIEPPNDGQGGP